MPTTDYALWWPRATSIPSELVSTPVPSRFYLLYCDKSLHLGNVMSSTPSHEEPKAPHDHAEAVDRKKQDIAKHLEYSENGLSNFDDSIEETRPSKAVWLITFTVAMGGFLFGT